MYRKCGGPDKVVYVTSSDFRYYQDSPQYRWEPVMSFADGIAYLDSNSGTIVIEKFVPINNDTTIPANISVDIRKGGGFVVASTKTLTINGNVIFNAQSKTDVFTGAGSVSFGGSIHLTPQDMTILLAEVGSFQIKKAVITKSHTSDLFDAAALTDSANIWEQPANSIFLYGEMKLGEQFAATSLTDLVVTVGDGGDADGILLTTGNLTSVAVGTLVNKKGAYVPAGLLYKSDVTQWLAYATAIGANLSTTTAGSLTFTFVYLQF